MTFFLVLDTLRLMFLPRSIANAVDQVARQALGKDWNLYAALLSHWQEIVGEEYARVTTPVKITFPSFRSPTGRRENGTLYIRLPQGLAMEFTFKTNQIIQRICGYFGYAAIGKIMFETVYSKPAAAPAAETEADPVALAQFKEQAEAIENDDLQAALTALGESVLKAAPKASQKA